MLQLLDLDRVYTSYGFPNDMLVHLNVWNARVRDFPSRPIYGVGERSGIKISGGPCSTPCRTTSQRA